MMESSLRCFAFGLLALVPVIGPVFAIFAAWHAGRARIAGKHYWNPAQTLLLWGTICAPIGAILWTGVDILVVWQILNPSRDS